MHCTFQAKKHQVVIDDNTIICPISIYGKYRIMPCKHDMFVKHVTPVI
jgi:hypothetical protein